MRAWSSDHAPIGFLLPLCVLALLACGDGPTDPATGDLHVLVTTTGADPDADGYLLSVDGGAAQRVAASAESAVSGLALGEHQLAVSEIASNCTLQGDNPRTVLVEGGRAADAEVIVACVAAQGSLRVDAASAGWDVDGDGYQVLIDESLPARSARVGPSPSPPFPSAPTR